jgi:hypothetical protein
MESDMPTQRFCVELPIPASLRETLLGLFPPAFPDVYCRHVTLAYGVPQDHLVDDREREVLCYAYHRDDYTDAILVLVDGRQYQPDRPGDKWRRPFHITLSTVAGVSPVKAGFVRDTANVHWVETDGVGGGTRQVLRLRPRLVPVQRTEPERRAP